VACDGRLYFSGEYCNITIIQAGPEYKFLSTNPMGEICTATLPIMNKTL
jgi:hypothetical protein